MDLNNNFMPSRDNGAPASGIRFREGNQVY